MRRQARVDHLPTRRQPQTTPAQGDLPVPIHPVANRPVNAQAWDPKFRTPAGLAIQNELPETARSSRLLTEPVASQVCHEKRTSPGRQDHPAIGIRAVARPTI